VVDYFLVSIDNLQTCKSIEIIPPRIVFDRFCSADLVGTTGSYSFVTCSGNRQTFDSGIQTLDSLPHDHIFYKRFNIDVIPNNFLSSDMSRQSIEQLNLEIQGNVTSQEHVNAVYYDFCEIYHSEMINTFRVYNTHPNAKKKLFRKAKPFWNDELQQLWYEVKRTEHLYVRAEKQDAVIARTNFKRAQDNFDKVYRREERHFNRLKLMDLENNVNNNPRDFWKMIKQLGPHKKTEIPFEVYDEDGNVISDTDFVLNKWKSDYEKLYQHPVDADDFDDGFFRNCMEELHEMESDENIESLPHLNDEINEEEVKAVIRGSKNKKSVGLDNLPNEVFKNEKSVKVLTTLFRKFFELCLIPSLWRKAVLKPIPKGSTTDVRVPLEYRGISLLSTVYKMFSSLLNKRLISCCEVNGLYADEQNGFRGGRSCDDHCFVLSTIIRQRKAMNISTFVGFVDLKKAFDCVDRQLLLYKLLVLLSICMII
jgi:hypothetical protein